MVFFSSPKYKTHRFIALYVSVLFLWIAAFGYYYESTRPDPAPNATSASRMFHTDMAYYDMPRMTVSVGSGDVHMRIDVALEVAKKDVPMVEGYQPRITAKLNSYLSTLSPERIQEAKMLPWLRAEMLAQINSVGAPIPVHDLVFRQLVVM